MIYWAKRNDKGWTRKIAKRFTETINRFNEAFYYLKINLAFLENKKSDNKKTEMSSFFTRKKVRWLKLFSKMKKNQPIWINETLIEKSLRIRWNTKIHILNFSRWRTWTKRWRQDRVAQTEPARFTSRWEDGWGPHQDLTPGGTGDVNLEVRLKRKYPNKVSRDHVTTNIDKWFQYL